MAPWIEVSISPNLSGLQAAGPGFEDGVGIVPFPGPVEDDIGHVFPGDEGIVPGGLEIAAPPGAGVKIDFVQGRR